MKNTILKTNTITAFTSITKSKEKKAGAGLGSVFGGSDNDQMAQIFAKLRNFDIFNKQILDKDGQTSSQNKAKVITSDTETKLRLIASSGNSEREKADAVAPGDVGRLDNIKVYKKNL